MFFRDFFEGRALSLIREKRQFSGSENFLSRQCFFFIAGSSAAIRGTGEKRAKLRVFSPEFTMFSRKGQLREIFLNRRY
jgi:hypothetical protein